jgi:hypothetical protein
VNAAQIRRWGKLPEDLPAFEFGGGRDYEYELRIAVPNGFTGFVDMICPKDGHCGGQLNTSNFYKPLTRAARELLAVVDQIAIYARKEV